MTAPDRVSPPRRTPDVGWLALAALAFEVYGGCALNWVGRKLRIRGRR